MTLKLRAKQARRTDKRISLIGEVVSGIRAVKMYVWEKYLEKMVYSARSLEIQNYMRISYLLSAVMTFSPLSHRLSAFAVSLVYTLQRGRITAEKIFPVTLYLFNLRTSISIFFFFGLRNITDAFVALKRIEDFLLRDEVELSVEGVKENNIEEAILIENVSVVWDEKTIVFDNISLSFAPENLYVITGSVGSGKSSLLKLILGELQTVSGKVFVRGAVSYVSQEPWLFNGSVRDNILFGDIYGEDKYEKVVNACALIEDFNLLPHGDKTLVGDRGGNLSGGQCTRINLARAVYRDADIYLLDDPLSAVDTHVAKKIMEDCVNGLLADKTRILVTHNIQQLSGVAEIVVLKSGKVEFKNLEELQQDDHYVTQSTVYGEESLEENKNEQQTSTPMIIKQLNVNGKKEPEETQELLAKGAMKSSIYLSYIKAGGWNFMSLVVLFNCVFIMAVTTFDFGSGAWINNEKVLVMNETANNHTEYFESIPDSDYQNIKQSLFILGGLIILILVTSFLKNLFLYKFTLGSSENIHNSIFSRLMMSTMQFFDSNSTGKILNRFSEDTGVMDNVLSKNISETLTAIIHVAAILLAAIIANWWILIPLNVFLYISFALGKIYARTIQQIKRLVGIAKSPILSFANSTLAGLTTIRACRAQSIVMKDFDSRQDCYTAANFLTVASSKACDMWIEFVNLGLVASVAYLCVFLKTDATYESYVGLSLTQVFIMSEMVPFATVAISEVFAAMVSVERMLQFEQLEQETLIEDDDLEVPNSWPDQGKIVFEHLYLRYSNDDEPVLWDLNCVIEPGSKIGIVGRTGAGKSSLISALFRFAKIEGYIFIDDVNIKRVDLYKLRSKLSIIPQQPVLFKGSLRKNLDPWDKFEDASLWSALENVELKHIFDSLDNPVEQGGNNLSVGQRQLLCLARALVNKNKILILDEATANVDPTTDALIQKTLRNQFKECTVLTIAHRLNTVMDSDKILVMDSGKLVEYDHPFVLLQNHDSYFFKLVQQMGNTTRQHLTDIAEEAYSDQKTTDRSSDKP